MDHQTPSYRTFGYFINEILQDKIENIFNDINHAIFNDEHVDLQHLYIDGSKFEAKRKTSIPGYGRRLPKSSVTSFTKKSLRRLRRLMQKSHGAGADHNKSEYVPDYLNEIVEQLVLFMGTGYKYICLRKWKAKIQRTALIMNT